MNPAQNLVTPELLEELYGDNCIKAEKHIKELYPEYPSRPPYPTLNVVRPTSEQALKYAQDLAKYEDAILQYKSKKAEYDAQYNILNTILEQYIWNISGLTKLVPEDRQRKVWNLAWEKGHSNGYYEVYLELCQLVELFD